MRNFIKITKTRPINSETPSLVSTKDPRFEDLAIVETLSTDELRDKLGGNAFTETERILTFDKGY